MVARQAHHHPEQAAMKKGAQPRMDIIVKNLQKKVRLNSPLILKITRAILRHENVDQSVLSVVFVTHQKIKALNKKYLNRDHVTDVLAFDMNDNANLRRKPRTIMGDIVISTDAALKNIKMFKTQLSHELALYLTHGILHLLGFNDHKSADVKRMRKREEEVLSILGTKIKNFAHVKK